MLDPVVFGQTLRLMRIKSGIETMKELYEITGVSPQTISNLENGHAFPTLRTLEVIMQGLNPSRTLDLIKFAIEASFEGTEAYNALRSPDA